MATKNSLIVNIANGTKTAQKVFADVNPSATNAELKAFAQGLVGLTDYSYSNGTLVERTDLDDTSTLPFPTGSLWLGDKKIRGDSLFSDCPISIAELIADTANVTHDNGRLKFKFEVRDVYADSKGTPLRGSSPFTFEHSSGDNITDLRMLHYYDLVSSSSTYLKWVLDFDIPDTVPSPSYFVRILQAATRYTKESFLDLNLRA